MANIGTCPTFDNLEFSLEVHLMDFSGDLYGEELGVDFSARLREERRFPSIEALAKQIHEDIAVAEKGVGRRVRWVKGERRKDRGIIPPSGLLSKFVSPESLI